ncbi:hypothetical protein [Microcystis phage MaeS]|nr:hypothetical protein [Microcystis phage MaeS]
MDIDVSVQMKPSQANGLFQEIEDIKRQRLMLKDKLDAKTEELADYILKNGNIIAYKNDVPYVVTVGSKENTVFNKAQLSSDTGESESNLNLVGIAKLVEDHRVSSETLKDYYQVNSKPAIKARKAKKKDLEMFRTRGQI